MDLHIDALTEMVALRLGELPDLKSGMWTTGTGCTLRDMVECGLELRALRISRELPLGECQHLKDLTGTLLTMTDWGLDTIFCCELPGDFLRLHTLWMPDWPEPLSEERPGDPLRLALGENAPPWLAKRSARPMLRIIAAGDNSSATLWFGPSSLSSPRAALYVPAPRYESDEGTLRDLQPACAGILADQIAGEIEKLSV